MRHYTAKWTRASSSTTKKCVSVSCKLRESVIRRWISCHFRLRVSSSRYSNINYKLYSSYIVLLVPKESQLHTLAQSFVAEKFNLTTKAVEKCWFKYNDNQLPLGYCMATAVLLVPGLMMAGRAALTLAISGLGPLGYGGFLVDVLRLPDILDSLIGIYKVLPWFFRISFCDVSQLTCNFISWCAISWYAVIIYSTHLYHTQTRIDNSLVNIQCISETSILSLT